MKAIYAGSFSPPTMGHLDVIRRAAALFDELIVAVVGQSEKQYSFSLEARADMVRRVVRDIPGVRVVSSTGLLVDLARQEGADVLLRGLRDRASIPILTKPAAARELGREGEALFTLGAKAHDLYVLGFPAEGEHRPGMDWRTGPVIVE